MEPRILSPGLAGWLSCHALALSMFLSTASCSFDPEQLTGGPGPGPGPGDVVCVAAPGGDAGAGRVVAYVNAAGGSDSNPGTIDAPLATIEAGIARAGVMAASASVLVAAGVYEESLVLANGISICGGFDATAGWERDPAAYPTEIRGQGVVMSATSIERDTWLDGLTITGVDATAPGQSSIAVLAVSSSGLRLRGVKLRPGNGAAGEAGMPGPAGDPG
ncbi:MAG TPA: hypothetical protein VNM90_00565, partial [Haliangium sp.]|nr:hypothetical protein [Haliangium sp.]